MVALHNARDTYDPSRPFRPWFFAIARYKTVDQIRRIKKFSGDQSIDVIFTLEAVEECCEPHQLDEMLTLKALLKELAPEYREAVVMTKIEGLSIAEAASRSNTSESSMKVRVHRAVQKLKSAWRSGS